MPELIVPAAIEAVIEKFDQAAEPFTVFDVQQALDRTSLQNLSEGEKLGTLSEVLAFSLTEGRDYAGPSPWGTYFCPIASGTNKDGEIVYFPDISQADATVVAHWACRARSVTNPVLKARYADLVWDLGPVLTDTRRDADMARLAIDAYLAAVPVEHLASFHERFEAALRALDLAALIRDEKRSQEARCVLLRLHRDVIEAGSGPWWFAFDRLISDKNTGITQEERDQLVTDLEQLVLRYGDTTEPSKFDPHLLQDAAKRLIKHYTRLRRPADAKRLQVAIARAFEHFASLGDAMLGSAVLQTAVNAYREAGLPEESKRTRILMEEKIAQSRDELAPIETEIKVSTEDMERFLDAVVVADLGGTFVRIASNLLPSKVRLEQAVAKSSEQAPLMSLMPQKIMADDHIAGMIGSVLDDPHGRLLQQTTMDLGLSGIWLHAALDRTIEKHGVSPEHIVAWANRHGLFNDVTFLLEGVQAWFEGDLTKAVHVLVPQVERGLRAIVGQLGRPVTKPHPRLADVGVALTMGDIVYDDAVAEALGPDLTLYFTAVYADPRGVNLRNRVAHGQLEAVTTAYVQLVIHTLLVFGVWKEFAERRR